MLVSETSAAAGAGAGAINPPQESAVAWKQIVEGVEPFLQLVHRELEAQVQSFDPEIASYAAYALCGQGKQLRPALLALSARATGDVSDAHVRAAVIIEMVHLATLVHDDVMDEAQIRRSRPTLAAKWGNESAVLLGDCLFAQALKLAAGFPTTEICRAVATAANTVCAGEILQNKRRDPSGMSRSDYFKILQMKTGELFSLSCDLGAFLNGAGAERRLELGQFGMALGTAYQVFDDCLDLFGSERVAGKSLGTDLVQGKLTLPVLLLLERVNASEREQVRAWLGHWHPDHFAALRQRLEESGVLEDTVSVVQEYLGIAMKALRRLPASEGRQGLDRLVLYLEQQMGCLSHTSRVLVARPS